MQNFVKDVIENNPVTFRDKVSDVMMKKIGDRLEVEKMTTASKVFGLLDTSKNEG